MRWLWVNGWGVEPEALKGWAEQLFPSVSHSVVLPGKLEYFEKHLDRIIGWSWGAFRILELLVESSDTKDLPPISLVAPFLGFCQEDQLGGKCSRVQVNFLKRWMVRNPVAALGDFYQRAGIPFKIPSGDSRHFSFWVLELEAMAKEKMDLEKVKNAFTKVDVRIMVGEDDPLVDASWLVQRLGAIPVKGIGHSITKFDDLF